MEQGESERKIREQARQLNMPLPDKFKNKPKLGVGLEMYWRAFTELSGDRQVGMGEGPIPYASIHHWGVRNQIYGDDFDRLVAVIRGVDASYMEARNKAHKRAMASAKKGGKKAPSSKALRSK